MSNEKRVGLWTGDPAPQAGTYQVNVHLCQVDLHAPKPKIKAPRGYHLPNCPRCNGEANWVPVIG